MRSVAIIRRDGRPLDFVAPLWQCSWRKKWCVQLSHVVWGDGTTSSIYQTAVGRAARSKDINMRSTGGADIGIKKDAYHAWRRFDGRTINRIGTNHKSMCERGWRL